MRAAIGAAVAAILGLAPACENCSCGGPPVMNLVVTASGGPAIPLGFYQTLGAQIPGYNRNLVSSDVNLALPVRTDPQDDGSSLIIVYPRSDAFRMKPRRFGGTVTLTATGGWFQSAWSITVEIATDPVAGYAARTYVGSGTTVMQVGQTFVMTWPVGSAPPSTTDAGVLAPLGHPIRAFVATQQRGTSKVTRGASYMEQLFAAVAPGKAVLNAPDAIDPMQTLKTFGPNQRFVVKDDPRWACSPAGGCVTTGPEDDSTTRPDSYIPPGGTGAPSPTPSLRPNSAPGP